MPRQIIGEIVVGRSKFQVNFFPIFFLISHVMGQTKMAQKFHIMKLTLTLASVHMK